MTCEGCRGARCAPAGCQAERELTAGNLDIGAGSGRGQKRVIRRCRYAGSQVRSKIVQGHQFRPIVSATVESWCPDTGGEGLAIQGERNSLSGDGDARQLKNTLGEIQGVASGSPIRSEFHYSCNRPGFSNLLSQPYLPSGTLEVKTICIANDQGSSRLLRLVVSLHVASHLADLTEEVFGDDHCQRNSAVSRRGEISLRDGVGVVPIPQPEVPGIMKACRLTEGEGNLRKECATVRGSDRISGRPRVQLGLGDREPVDVVTSIT